MTGSRLFQALCTCQGSVMKLATGWTKADTAAVTGALLTQNWKLVPRKLRDLLEEIGADLQGL